MLSFWLLTGAVAAAVAALLLAASDGFAWVMATLGMLMMLALVLFLFTARERWSFLPMDSVARKRREGRTILDILGNEKEL